MGQADGIRFCDLCGVTISNGHGFPVGNKLYCEECSWPLRAASRPVDRVEEPREQDPSPVPRRKRSRILTLGAVLGVFVVGLFVYWATRHNDLESCLEGCESKGGIDVRVDYGSLFSREEIVFDLRDTGSQVRRIDPLHLLMQFAHNARDKEFKYVILSRNGKKLFLIEQRDLLELSDSYSNGGRIWAFNHFPERVLSMDGRHPYGSWTGGWLGVLKRQTEDLNAFLTAWLEY